MSGAVDIFQEMVTERANLIRQLTFEQLNNLEAKPIEYVTVEKRQGRITTYVRKHMASDGIRVVVQGFLRKRVLRMVWDVALDGFYRYPDGKMAPLPREDMWEFD